MSADLPPVAREDAPHTAWGVTDYAGLEPHAAPAERCLLCQGSGDGPWADSLCPECHGTGERHA